MNEELLPVAQVRRRKLSEDVAEQLQALMLNGQLKPNQQMPSERDLMNMFGVGRTSIREALYSLQRMGLVSLKNGERAVVTKPSASSVVNELSGAVAHVLADPRGVKELQQARALYEVMLVRFAAQHATDADVGRLAQALENNRAAIGKGEAFARTDVAFHQILAEIPDNSIFTSLQMALSSWLAEQRTVSLRVEDAERDAYEAHKSIYEAVQARDPDEAERAMARHLNAVEGFYWTARAGE